MQNSNEKPSVDVMSPTGELYKFLENEIAYRRNRKQEIFNWASSLLVAVIGGIVALAYKNANSLSPAHKILLTGAIVVLSGYSYWWINVHWKVAIAARKQLSSYYDRIVDAPKDRDWPSILALLALTLLSLLAVWI